MSVARAEQFLADFKAAYDQGVSYHPAEHLEPIVLTPGKKFAKKRTDKVKNYIDSRKSVEDDPRAFLSEWATFLAIAKPLDEQGYTVEMAPQELEAGDENRKGVDLVISKRVADTSIPLLGINVKLRSFRASKETLRFDPKLCAPMITVSLGNWRAENRHPEPLKIREWMDHHAVPKITSTGKLPHFNQFRAFVLQRTTNTLSRYLWKTESHIGGFYDTEKIDDEDQDNEKHFFPENETDMHVFYDKLFTVHKVFEELSRQPYAS